MALSMMFGGGAALHDIASGIRMKYLPKRKWSNSNKRRAQVMVQDIDKKLFERRLMRNLEKFVGGREYGNDLRLLNGQYEFTISCPISIQGALYEEKPSRRKCEITEIVPTEMELILKQPQQGVSHEVSVSTEGVEE
ncbi:hypothetical protein Tco_1084184 [Tanacetum coccineum]